VSRLFPSGSPAAPKRSMGHGRSTGLGTGHDPYTVPVANIDHRSTRKPVWGVFPQLPHAPRAPHVPSPPRRHTLLLARWPGSDRAAGSVVVRDDGLDAPPARSSSARRRVDLADEMWSAAARSATHVSISNGFGRDDRQCAILLGTFATDERATIRAAVVIVRARTVRMLMDCCSRRRHCTARSCVPPACRTFTRVTSWRRHVPSGTAMLEMNLL
jgi:hypothetical protein